MGSLNTCQVAHSQQKLAQIGANHLVDCAHFRHAFNDLGLADSRVYEPENRLTALWCNTESQVSLRYVNREIW